MLWLPAIVDSDFESQKDAENDRGSLPVRLSFHECNSLNSRAFLSSSTVLENLPLPIRAGLSYFCLTDVR